jgi:hypothetical protein
VHQDREVPNSIIINQSIKRAILYCTQRTHCTSFIKTNRLKGHYHGSLYEPQRTHKCAVRRRVVHMFTTEIQANSESQGNDAAWDKNGIAVSSSSWRSAAVSCHRWNMLRTKWHWDSPPPPNSFSSAHSITPSKPHTNDI